MIIDTHAHVNFNAFRDDADEAIKRALCNDIWMINVGSQFSTSRRAVAIAERYPRGVYAAIGLHPIHLTEGIFKTKTDAEEISFVSPAKRDEIKKETEFPSPQTKNEQFISESYKDLASSKKVVAIGEIGLDYYYRPKGKTKLEQFKNRQKEELLAQMDLAAELNLPIIFHCRSAHKDLIEILNHKIKTANYKPNGVIHCFTGNSEEAKQYLGLGLYLGLNGIMFKLDLNEAIKNIPMDRILIETDCPYLTPPSFEGRNEPLYIKSVVQRIAEIKGVNFSVIENATTENARSLFKI